MRRIKRIHFVRLIGCLLAISLSLGSVANASMMGMMPVAQADMTMDHDGNDNDHEQSPGVMSHVQLMQSGDHGGSHDMTCELLCAVSMSLLPHIGFVPEVFHLTQLWPVPESPDYLSNLHTLLYKPPRI